MISGLQMKLAEACGLMSSLSALDSLLNFKL